MVSVNAIEEFAGLTPDMSLAVHCCKSAGLEESSYELSVMKKMRDKHLMGNIGGCMKVADYFFYAPRMVDAIKERDDAKQFSIKLFNDFYARVVEAEENYEHEKAIKIFDDCFLYCSKELGVKVGTG